MVEVKLNDTSLTLLAIIRDRPLNPYRISKVLAEGVNGQLVSIKESTCYAAIRSLERHGMISADIQQSSNMTMKKVYSITEKGKSKLEDYLVRSLSSLESTASAFEKSIGFICSISRGAAIQAIQKHQSALEVELEALQNRNAENRTNRRVSFASRILTRQMVKKRQVELDTLNELKKAIEWEREWDYSPVDSLFNKRRL